MNVRITQLWKIPVFCLVAGFVSFYAYVLLVSRFAIVQLPDGSYTANNTLTLLFSTLFFLLTLAAGQLFLRNMTATERILSATIQVVLLMVFRVLPSNSLLSAYATEWSRVIDHMVFVATDNIRIAAWSNCFSPLLLIPQLKRR